MQNPGKRMRLTLLVIVGLWLTGITAPAAGAQSPTPTEKPAPAGPPPIRLPLSSLTPEATIPMAGRVQIAATGDAVWVVNRADGALSRVDPKTNIAAAAATVGKEPCHAPVFAFKSLWTALCGASALARVDPAVPAEPGKDPKDTKEPKDARVTVIATAIRGAGPLATGTGSIWMATDGAGTLARVDPDTNQVVAEVTVPTGASAITFGENAVWVASAKDDTVTRVNGFTNLIAETIKVGRSPIAVAVGAGGVWAFNGGDGTVSRIDTKTNKVSATIKTGITAPSGAIIVGEGSVWLSAPGTPLARIDPATNRLVQAFTGPGGGAIVVGHQSLWITATPTAIWRVDPKRVDATRR